jgi:hypothetical protein
MRVLDLLRTRSPHTCARTRTHTHTHTHAHTHTHTRSRARTHTRTRTRAFLGRPQEEYFKLAFHRIVEHVIHGLDVCVFAYGEANAGKSYTIRGGEGAKNAGLMARSLEGTRNTPMLVFMPARW